MTNVEALYAEGRRDFSGANLYGANLYGANLTGAILTGVNLTGANLTGANLYGATLTGAILSGAILSGAILSGATLTGAVLPAFQIPQEGGLTVWKKLHGGVLAQLLIPAKAKRTASLVGRKCRAEYVVVLKVIGAKQGTSPHDGKTLYKKGAEVHPDKYDPDIRVECSHGIHFFLTRKEAEDY